MPSTKTISKGIRITNEAAEFYADKPLNRIAESLIPYLKSGVVTFSDGELKINGSGDVHTDTRPTVADNLSGLREMAGCFGLTGEELLESVVSGLEYGSLTVKDGELVGAEEQWVSDFRDACHDKGLIYEKIAEKAIQSIKRGLL